VGARKSLVLVTVDCLRADHVGFMGYDRATTPFLDSLADKSFVFPAAIVAGAPTYYSFPAIMSSRYPLALGRDVLGLSPEEPSLASVFKSAGYATASFGAGNPYISARFGYEHGFDTFRDFLDAEPVSLSDPKPNSSAGERWATRLNRTLHDVGHRLGPAGAVYDELYFQYCQRLGTPAVNSFDALRRFPAADVIVDQARSWLASIGQAPFFLWLHLMDPHSPYYPAEKAFELMASRHITPFRARYLNSYWNRSDLGSKRFARHKDDVIALYDAGVRWVDAQMQRLVDALRRFELWDDCIFAFTADHGEEFLDHGGRYHPPSNLMEELIRVPLLLRVPNVPKTPVAASPFSMLHLAPTLLEAAQLPAPETFHGHSYWRQMTSGTSWDDVAISECIVGCTNPLRAEARLGPRVLSVRESRFKLVLHFNPQREDLYDLEGDAKEQNPLPPSAQKPVRQRMLEAARTHLRDSIERRDPSARLRARLRELQLEWAKPANRTSPVVS
jgi:arylsulfatase A-like enzyme